MITKSHNHSHFWTENRIVYESYNTIRGMRFRQIIELPFYYPNHLKLTDMMIQYLNRCFEMFPKHSEILNSDEPQIDQLTLF